MWEKSGGEFRIAIVRSVMKNLLATLPDNTRVGLVAYGHRSKEDCDDIETLIPLALLNRTTLAAQLESLNPVGKTPIAKSIEHALELVKAETVPVTIVLLTDGLETCEGSACDIVKQAKAQGVKIVFHAVGFGISGKDLSALECVAQAGGGQYFPADNADELAVALEQSVASPVTGGGYLSVKATLNGRLLDASVQVFRKGEKKPLASGRTYEKEATNPRVLTLPPGKYDAAVTAVDLDGKPVQLLSNIAIAAGQRVDREIDFSEGKISIAVTRNGALSDATLTIFKAGTREQVASGRSYAKAEINPAVYRILPGTYDVEVKSVEIEDSPVKRFEKQVLNGNASLNLAHDFASGELKIGARQRAGLVDATVSIISKKTGKSVAAGRTYATTGTNPKTFVLEPGDYRAELSPVKPKGLAKKSFEVSIKAKETVERTGEW